MKHNRPPDLCDVCRQHRPIHHFVDIEMGAPRDRHVCATCFAGYRASSAPEVIDIDELVLSRGKCERCGAPAFCISGIPGPNRTVLCHDCAERECAGESAEA